MKTEVYYFTGTGNSLVVARDIAKELGAETIAIPSVIDRDKIQTDADVIGIIFPVYIWGPPLIVERFVRKIDNLGSKYVFAITTYGGMPGATLPVLAKIVAECGGKLAAGFGVGMPGNYTPMYGAIAAARQQKMFAKWQGRVKQIAEYIRSKQEGKLERNNFLANAIFTGFFYRMGHTHIPEMDKSFVADEKCTGCGICQKVCPVSNIELSGGKPTWKKRCEQCMACLQWCPETAIQCGSKTASRKRYHHPDVKLADLMKKG